MNKIQQANQESRHGNNLNDKNFKSVAGLYEKSLKFPAQKYQKQLIICPIGLVSSGKTTVVKILCKKLPLLRVSTDEIRLLLKEKEYNFTRTRELAWHIINKYLKQGFSIAIDADCISEEARKYIKDLEKQTKTKVFWIHINPPRSFILNNLSKPKKIFKNTEHALRVYKMHKVLHNKINFPFIYIFDTAKNNVIEQTKECVLLIKKELS